MGKCARKTRIQSLYIVHLSMFILSLGFSLTLTSVYPYIKQLLPHETEDSILFKYGWIVAANPLGQMIFSPLLGWLYNKVQTLRIFSFVSFLLFGCANILYATVSMVPSSKVRYFLLLTSRFSMGLSSALIAPLRAYVSASTSLDERTRHLSYISMFQTLGFLLGPVLQAAFISFGNSLPSSSDDSYIVFNMYTIPGWFSALCALFCTMLYLPIFFKEYNVTSTSMSQDAEDNSQKNKPDYLAALCCILNFFIFQFIFVLLEALGTPLCLDQFGWTEEATILYLGICMLVGGVISLICYFSIPKLSTKVDERWLYYFLGLLPMLLGRLVLFSYGSHTPSMWNTLENKLPGCHHDWCDKVPSLKPWQFFLSYFFVAIGISYCLAITQTLFSKILGPRPQGLWMGVLTAFGSSARVLGPIVVSYVYNFYGNNVTTGLTLVIVLLSILISIIFFKRLVPFSPLNSKELSTQRETTRF